MPDSIIQRTFAGGELAPIHHARADQAKYLTGLRTCRNFIVRREGGVSNRAGYRYTDTAKNGGEAGVRFMRYVAASGSDFLIEMGAAYFRFYRDGAAVLVSGVAAYNGATNYVPGDIFSSAGTNYYVHTATVGTPAPDAGFYHPLTGDIFEVPTPYAIDSLPDWDQSANVITLTHPSTKPRELVYSGPTNWVLRDISTAPSIAAPAGLAAVAGTAGALNYAYLVTAAKTDTYEESVGSTPDTVACAAPTPAAPNTLTWTVNPDAAEYYVYCDPYGNGVYGYIGTASTNAFADTGFVPDFGLTPPIGRVLFDSANNYPAHSARFQQRRFFANTLSEPDAIFGSRTGFPSNFGITSPLQDDDALTFRIAASGNHGAIRHMRALKAGLVLLTDGGAWPLTGGGGPKSPITPSSVDAEQETYVGVSEVRPVVIGNALLYVQARGAIVHDLRFDQQVEGLAGKDLTIWATHLFERKTIVAMDFQQNPHSITWAVLDDGTIAALTYIPEQEIWGWHRHDTVNGSFEDVCVVGEGDEDAVYVLVAREINGSTVRYIERLERRDIRETHFNLDAFFVDSGLSYDGAAADTFSGLDHLEGEQVAILADGDVVSNGSDPAYVVTAGEVSIPTAAARVHIGLPIQYADLETLDLDVAGSDVRDKKKRVAGVAVLVERSSRAFYAGPDEDSLRLYDRAQWEAAGDETTGRLEVSLPAEYAHSGRVLVRMTEPLPLTILGIIPSVEAGG